MKCKRDVHANSNYLHEQCVLKTVQQNYLSIERGPTANVSVTRLYDLYCCCDLELEPMTLIYELGLDILTMYLHTNF